MPHEEERLRAATVAVIGTDGPGSAVLEALATAGVGRRVVCDAGRSRTQAAAERLHELAPEVTVLARDRAPVGPTDVAPLAALADVVVDCASSPGATSAACLKRGVAAHHGRRRAAPDRPSRPHGLLDVCRRGMRMPPAPWR